MRRRKNPHPKRAVNARTVLKCDVEERGGEEEEKEEQPPVLCLRIPDEVEFEANQIQKEEEEEEGEEEGEEADEDVERLLRILSVPCVAKQNEIRKEETAFIAKGVKRKRGHTSAMFARRCL